MTRERAKFTTQVEWRLTMKRLVISTGNMTAIDRRTRLNGNAAWIKSAHVNRRAVESGSGKLGCSGNRTERDS